jgi:hypothetical protein
MDNQSYSLYIGVIGIVVAIVVPIIIYYKQKKKKRLIYEEVLNLSVISINKDFKDKIEIKYCGRLVDHLFVSTATLKNKGTLSVKKSDMIKPIEITFDTKILDCNVIEINPKGIDVSLNANSEGNSIKCEFNLLNPHDYFTLQFVSLEKLSTPTIISRIEGLSKVNIASKVDLNSDRNILKTRILKKVPSIFTLLMLMSIYIFISTILGIIIG